MPVAAVEKRCTALATPDQPDTLAPRSQLCSPERAISVEQREKSRALPTIDEDRRRAKLAPVAAKWRNRAGWIEALPYLGAALAGVPYQKQPCRRDGAFECRCEACRPRQLQRYALGRAASIEKRIGPRLSQCGVEKVPIACCCGRRDTLVRCRQWWLCGECQAQRAGERKPRIETALAAALEREIEIWAQRGGARGTRPRLVLLTLTAPHTGDLVRDRKALADAWRAFYRSMHAKWGRFPYVGFWEVTPGRCAKCEGYRDLKPNSPRKRCRCASPAPEGHVHAHVVCVWRYRDYDRVRSMWRSAVRCKSAYMNIVADRRDGKPSSPRSAAKYLAKYVSKGVQGDTFTPALRADVSAAMYNAHAFMASVRFWLPRDRTCRRCHVTVRRVIVLDPDIFDRIEPAERYYVTRRWDPLRDDRAPGHVIAVYPHEGRSELQDE